MLLKKIDAILVKSIEVLTVLFLATAIVVTFLQVIFRYVLSSPLSWSQEVLMICFVYSVLLGAALIINSREHLTVDLFENAGKMLLTILRILEFIVVGVVIVILFYFGLELVSNNFASGQTLGFLKIQKAYVYLIIPISAFLMFYFHIKKVFR
ncbi:hypothetical protein CEY16_08395 [Halalkalibacillus sediminis]|uniref:Tripartite ATP-independent periplasmic transporters DctQ component domain-containing protein n=1 Tax=Halalkalibacillus sediminis TaxID=2018042 RepID=A0A2I0QUG6_9BACI|nr:TRAP transporter small permease subunit [Halalkalibacillus sediminis]PKR77934.1 hypothetical protein CEY16_08395 [Halalkalibacillus sediminis]